MARILLGASVVVAVVCAAGAKASGPVWRCYGFYDGHGWSTVCLPTLELE